MFIVENIVFDKNGRCTVMLSYLEFYLITAGAGIIYSSMEEKAWVSANCTPNSPSNNSIVTKNQLSDRGFLMGDRIISQKHIYILKVSFFLGKNS